MKLECCNNKPVVSCKELGTPVNRAIQEDPPACINEDLLSYPSGIAIPSPAVQLWSLEPAILNLLNFAKPRRRELLMFLVSVPVTALKSSKTMSVSWLGH